jgi:hypothetical protein
MRNARIHWQLQSFLILHSPSSLIKNDVVSVISNRRVWVSSIVGRVLTYPLVPVYTGVGSGRIRRAVTARRSRLVSERGVYPRMNHLVWLTVRHRPARTV